LLCGLPARGAEFTIIRDTFAVPHIFGETAAASAYGLGRARCEDNVATVVYCLYVGVGRLAELMGPNYAALDRQARTEGHGHFARADWPRLDPGLRRVLRAYCDGVNDYLKAHLDELPIRVPPVEPVQVVARFRQIMTRGAFGISRLDAEASRAEGYRPPKQPQDGGGHPGKSNSWALTGRKTAAGVPMLISTRTGRRGGTCNFMRRTCTAASCRRAASCSTARRCRAWAFRRRRLGR
jgi:acyl-homoserine lactone acylase PvdQ